MNEIEKKSSNYILNSSISENCIKYSLIFFVSIICQVADISFCDNLHFINGHLIDQSQSANTTI